MGFIEELKNKQEQKNKERQRLLSNIDRSTNAGEEEEKRRIHEIDEKRRISAAFLSQSEFPPLIEELSDVLRRNDEIYDVRSYSNSLRDIKDSITLSWRSGHSIFNKTELKKKEIVIQAYSTGLIMVIGHALLGTTALNSQEWSDREISERALEKAFKHPKIIKPEKFRSSGTSWGSDTINDGVGPGE